MHFQQVKQTTYVPFQRTNTSHSKSKPSKLQVNLNTSIPEKTTRTAYGRSTRGSHAQQHSRSLAHSLRTGSSSFSINESIVAPDRYQLSQLSMNKVFECLFRENSMEADPGAQGVTTSIKMMDTILFEDNFQPKKWIFTDLLGRIQFKDIHSISINDVIRAFLVNLHENKKNEFSNDDFMDFLSDSSNRDRICFAIVGNARHFLNIEVLSDIKNTFSKGIDALQLYKIPTRDFLPFFYYHSLSFKENSQLIQHTITRKSHFVMGLESKQTVLSEFYEEVIDAEERETFADQMIEVSKQIIACIQEKYSKSSVRSIKIAYLIEQTNYDPWFIGTEHCQMQSVMMNQESSREFAKEFRRKGRSIRTSKREEFVREDQISQSEAQAFVRPANLNTTTNTHTSLPPLLDTNLSEIGLGAYALERVLDDPEDVYELSNNDYVCKGDLYKGLLQIGQRFGKDQQQPTQRPSTMQMLKNNTLLARDQQQPSQRSKLSQKGQRLLHLFPKYMDKTGNKAHSNFLFGHKSSQRAFNDYQRLRFQQSANATATSEGFFGGLTSSGAQIKLQPPQQVFDISLSNVDATQMHTDPYQDSYFNNVAARLRNGRLSNNASNLHHSIEGGEAVLNQDISLFKQDSP